MKTPGKVNLILNVRSRREDGYHELDTVFYPIHNLSDEVTMAFARENRGFGISIVSDNPEVPTAPEKNLCGKAVFAYCLTAHMCVPDCRITIQKNIPCAGGMGGGSSDGAAVLLLMQEKYHRLTPAQMQSVALSLGADVPFFLNPVASRARGVGEKLEALTGIPENLSIAIAASDFPVSAKWSYEHWDPAYALPDDDADKLISSLQNKDLETAVRYMRNSLAPATFAKFPVLCMIRKAFMDHGALTAELSGSGPSVFALFPDHKTAEKACKELGKSMDAVRFIC